MKVYLPTVKTRPYLNYPNKPFLWCVGSSYQVTDGGKLAYVFVPSARLDHEALLPDDAPEVQEIHEAVKRTPIPKLIGRGKGCSMGSDPELFVIDSKTGVVIPAFDILPDKAHSNGLAYWDGFQAEFNPAARTCHEELADQIQYQLSKLLGLAKAVIPTATLTYKSVTEVPPEIMDKASDQHVTFGCSPSKNAYGEPPLTIGAPRQLPYRFAGCHIHLGIHTIAQKEQDPIPVVKAIDAVLGPVMTLLLQGLESPIRRQFYGKAGEYRLPRHGLEYRVPSSAVLVHPVAFFLLFDVARAAASYAHVGPHTNWFTADEAVTRAAINDLDLDAARRIIADNKEFYVALYKTIYAKLSFADRTAQIMAMVDDGIAQHIELDLVKNWKLGDEWPQYGRGLSVSSVSFLEPVAASLS